MLICGLQTQKKTKNNTYIHVYITFSTKRRHMGEVCVFFCLFFRQIFFWSFYECACVTTLKNYDLYPIQLFRGCVFLPFYSKRVLRIYASHFWFYLRINVRSNEYEGRAHTHTCFDKFLCKKSKKLLFFVSRHARQSFSSLFFSRVSVTHFSFSGFYGTSFVRCVRSARRVCVDAKKKMSYKSITHLFNSPNTKSKCVHMQAIKSMREGKNIRNRSKTRLLSQQHIVTPFLFF